MISFISRPEFRGTDRIVQKQYVMRISARLRGQKVAEYLGAKFNPLIPEGTCVWIKPRSLKNVKDGDYVDIIDGIELISILEERPKVNIIAISQIHYEYLKRELPNEVILIYHHHINFERKRHTGNKRLVGGFIGSPSKVAYEKYNEIKEALAEVGIEFTYCFHFQAREEMDGFYIPIENTEDIIGEVEKLKNKEYYSQFSGKICKEAEKYHISNTTKLYKNL